MRIAKKTMLGSKGKEYGIRSRVRVVKNKVAPPWQEAEFDIEWGKGISQEGDILDAVVAAGVVSQSGGYFRYNDDLIGHGRENAKQFLSEHPELFAELARRSWESSQRSKRVKREEDMALEYAREMAGALVELLAPACEQIEVAGSVRRQKAKPNDIEIVAVPKLTDQGRNLCDLACEDLLRTGQLEKRPDGRGRHCWGTGIKRAVFYQGSNYAPVDLFQVIEPRQWGVIYAIRTGPGDLNRVLVTSHRWGRGCPLDRKVAGGRVWFIDPGQEDLARMPATKFARLAERGEIEAAMIPTPEEEDFFRVLDVPCWPPYERTVERFRRHLRQM